MGGALAIWPLAWMMSAMASARIAEPRSAAVTSPRWRLRPHVDCRTLASLSVLAALDRPPGLRGLFPWPVRSTDERKEPHSVLCVAVHSDTASTINKNRCPL